MKLELNNIQLQPANIPKLIKYAIKLTKLEIVDCSQVTNIDSVGLAVLIYLKKLYNPQFENINQSLLDFCSCYKIIL